MTITEADRATARRVIRRHVGVGPAASVRVMISHVVAPRPTLVFSTAGLSSVAADRQHGEQVHVYRGDFNAAVEAAAHNAAVEAAAQGRAYAAALRGAK